MNYLTAAEKKRVVYSNHFCFPPRPQTDIEKAIERIILIQSIQFEGATAKATQERELQRNFEELQILTCSNRLGDKLKAAMVTPEKFEEFTDGYPYAKYHKIINGDTPLSPVELLGKDGFSDDDIRGIIRWIGMLMLTFHQDLPKDIDTFIWTPYTKWYKTHEMAKSHGDNAFYGYVLPADTQKHINMLFGEGDGRHGSCRWSMHHVRRTKIHKHPEVWKRFHMENIAAELFGKGVEMNFCEGHVRNGLTSGEAFYYLELKQESTNTRLRFIIEG